MARYKFNEPTIKALATPGKTTIFYDATTKGPGLRATPRDPIGR